MASIIKIKRSATEQAPLIFKTDSAGAADSDGLGNLLVLTSKIRPGEIVYTYGEAGAYGQGIDDGNSPYTAVYNTEYPFENYTETPIPYNDGTKDLPTNGYGQEFKITRAGLGYEVELILSGQDWRAGEKIHIDGRQFGGESPFNDLLIDITNVGINGDIISFTWTGVCPPPTEFRHKVLYIGLGDIDDEGYSTKVAKIGGEHYTWRLDTEPGVTENRKFLLIGDSRNTDYLKLRELVVDSAYISQLEVDSALIHYLRADSGYITFLQADSGFIDHLNVRDLDVDSAYLDIVNINSLDVDSAHIDDLDVDSAFINQLNVNDIDIDSGYADQFNVSQLDVDSAYIDTANINSLDADSAHIDDAIIDSAYIGQANINQADIDSAYIDQLNVSQADIDSAYIDQLNVSQADIDSAYIDQLNVSQLDGDSAFFNQIHVQDAIIDSAHIKQLDVRDLNVDSAFVDLLHVRDLDVDSAFFDQVNLRDIDADSAYIDILNVSKADIDSAHIDILSVNELTVDSAYIRFLGTQHLDLDSGHLNNVIIDSAYIGQANISQADIDSAYIDQINVSQADVDSAYIDQANISNLNVDDAFIDSAQITYLKSEDADIDSAYVKQLKSDYATIGTVFTGNLHGPSTIVIDPSAIGTESGQVIILGNLQVEGVETIVNSTTVTINDKNVVLADSAQNAFEADGAGITINGANANFTYYAVDDKFVIDRDLEVQTKLTADSGVFKYVYADSGIIKYLEGDSGHYTKFSVDALLVDSGTFNLVRTEKLLVGTASDSNSIIFIDSTGQFATDTNLQYDGAEVSLTDIDIHVQRGDVVIDSGFVRTQDLELLSAEDGGILYSQYGGDSVTTNRDFIFASRTSLGSVKNGLQIGWEPLYDSGYYRFYVDKNTGAVEADNLKLGYQVDQVVGQFNPQPRYTGDFSVYDFYGLDITGEKIVSTVQTNRILSDVLMSAEDSSRIFEVLSYDSIQPLFEVRKDGNINFAGDLYKNGAKFTGGGIFTKLDNDDAYFIPDPVALATNPYGIGGRVGLGLNDPKYNLHLSGSIAATGVHNPSSFTSPAIFALSGLPGYSDDSDLSRFAFIPELTAFRAGSWKGADWNISNFGEYSIAMGRNTLATNTSTIAIGDSAQASAINSVAIGTRSTIKDQNDISAIAIGTNNDAGGSYSITLGKDNVATDTRAIGIGITNRVEGNAGVAIGDSNTISATGDASIAIGKHNTVGGGGSVALGIGNIANGNPSFIMGQNNNIPLSTTNNAFILGISSTVNGDNSYAFGQNLTVDGLFHYGYNLSATNRTIDAERQITVVGGNVSIGSDSDVEYPDYEGHLYVKGNIYYEGDLLRNIPGQGLSSGNVFVDNGVYVEYTLDKNIGINLGNPWQKLEVGDAFGINGTYGGLPGQPDSSIFDSDQVNSWSPQTNDAHFLYNPRYNVFRVGQTDLTKNPNEYIGDHSIGLGTNNVVAGEKSIAIGEDLYPTGDNNIFIGTKIYQHIDAKNQGAGASKNIVLGNDVTLSDNASNNIVFSVANRKLPHTFDTVYGYSKDSQEVIDVQNTILFPDSSTLIGIGTFTPSDETADGFPVILDVTGNVNINGNLYKNGEATGQFVYDSTVSSFVFTSDDDSHNGIIVPTGNKTVLPLTTRTDGQIGVDLFIQTNLGELSLDSYIAHTLSGSLDAALNARVIGSTGPVEVTTISLTDPGVITTADPHGLVDGQYVKFNNIVGTTVLNGNWYFAKVITATTFEIYSNVNLTQSIDLTAAGAYQGPYGTAEGGPSPQSFTGTFDFIANIRESAGPVITMFTAGLFNRGDLIWIDEATGTTEPNQNQYYVEIGADSYDYLLYSDDQLTSRVNGSTWTYPYTGGGKASLLAAGNLGDPVPQASILTLQTIIDTILATADSAYIQARISSDEFWQRNQTGTSLFFNPQGAVPTSVGIGTSTPDLRYNLDVDGNANFGELYIDDMEFHGHLDSYIDSIFLSPIVDATYINDRVELNESALRDIIDSDYFSYFIDSNYIMERVHDSDHWQHNTVDSFGGHTVFMGVGPNQVDWKLGVGTAHAEERLHIIGKGKFEDGVVVGGDATFFESLIVADSNFTYNITFADSDIPYVAGKNPFVYDSDQIGNPSTGIVTIANQITAGDPWFYINFFLNPVEPTGKFIEWIRHDQNWTPITLQYGPDFYYDGTVNPPRLWFNEGSVSVTDKKWTITDRAFPNNKFIVSGPDDVTGGSLNYNLQFSQFTILDSTGATKTTLTSNDVNKVDTQTLEILNANSLINPNDKIYIGGKSQRIVNTVNIDGTLSVPATSTFTGEADFNDIVTFNNTVDFNDVVEFNNQLNVIDTNVNITDSGNLYLESGDIYFDGVPFQDRIEDIVDSDYIGERIATPWKYRNRDDSGNLDLYTETEGAVVVGTLDNLIDSSTRLLVDGGNTILKSTDFADSPGGMIPGVVPDYGEGSRFMWIGHRGALRAGWVDGVTTNWDDTEVEISSIALGYNATASAFSTAIGYEVGAGTSGAKYYSISIGSDILNAGDQSIALGHHITHSNTADQQISIGYNVSHGNTNNSVAIGYDVSAAELLAIGYEATSTSTGVSLGYDVTAGNNALSLGRIATSGNSSVSIGREATSHNTSVSLGRRVNSTNSSVSIGNDVTTSNSAIGVGASISAGSGSVVVGSGSTAGNSGVAIGKNNYASTGTTVIGTSSSAGQGSHAIGHDNNMSTYSHVIGWGNRDGYSSNIVGGGNRGNSYETVIGFNNTSNSRGGVLGWNNNNNSYGTVIGVNNDGNYQVRLVVGSDNHSNTYGATIFGVGNTSNRSITVFGRNNVGSSNINSVDNSSIYGNNSTISSSGFVYGKSNAISYGGFAFGDNLTIDHGGYAFGTNQTINNGGFAFGYDNTVDGAGGLTSYAYGAGNTVSGRGFAVGYDNTATTAQSVAIGHDNTTTGFKSTALGAYATASGNYAMAIGLGTGAAGYDVANDNTLAIVGGQVAINQAEAGANYVLDVNGNINSTDYYRQGKRLYNYILDDVTNRAWIRYNADSDYIHSAANFDYIHDLMYPQYFFGHDNYTNNLRYIGGGNVGIHVSQPQYDLDVGGDINFTGALYLSGDKIIPSIDSIGDVYVSHITNEYFIGPDSAEEYFDSAYVNQRVTPFDYEFFIDSAYVTARFDYSTVPSFTEVTDEITTAVDDVAFHYDPFGRISYASNTKSPFFGVRMGVGRPAPNFQGLDLQGRLQVNNGDIALNGGKIYIDGVLLEPETPFREDPSYVVYRLPQKNIAIGKTTAAYNVDVAGTINADSGIFINGLSLVEDIFTSDWVQGIADSAWIKSHADQEWIRLNADSDYIKTAADSDWIKFVADSDYIKTAANQEWIRFNADSDYIKTAADSDWIKFNADQEWIRYNADSSYILSAADSDYIKTAANQEWIRLNADSDYIKSAAGQDWIRQNADSNYILSAANLAWIRYNADSDYIHTAVDEPYIATIVDSGYVTDRVNKQTIRNLFSAGTGVIYTKATGQFKIGQAVSTTSNVQFNNITTSGNIIATDSGQTIGSLAKPFGELYLSGNSLYLDGTSIGLDNNSKVTIDGDEIITRPILITTVDSDYVSERVKASTVRGMFSSGGNGITYNQADGEFAIDSNAAVVINSLRTTNGLVVEGDLQVNGTTTTINSVNLLVDDNMIYLNHLESGNSPTIYVDLGFAGNYNDTGSYAHTGIFRDATDGRWKIFDGYTPEPDDDPQINTGHASFNFADLQVGTLYSDGLSRNSNVNPGTYGSASKIPVVTIDASGFIDSVGEVNVAGVTGVTYNDATGELSVSTADGNTFSDSITLQPFTTDNLTEGSNQYYTEARVTALVDSAYVQARQVDFFRDSAFITNIVDSAYVNQLADDFDYITVIDSAYVQARQVDFFRDSAFVTNIVDTVYIQARDRVRDSGFVQDIIDSDYIADRTPPSLTVQEVDSANGINKTISDVSLIKFDNYTGFQVSDLGNGEVKVALGSGFKTIQVDGQDDIVAIGEDTLAVDAGNGIILSTDAVTKALTIAVDSNFSGGVDSATVTSIIDSAYINARVDIDSNGDVTINNTTNNTYTTIKNITQVIGGEYVNYHYVATDGQRVFTGLDANNNSLNVTAGSIQVYLNGFNLLEGVDYTADSTSITLTDSASASDDLIVSALSNALSGTGGANVWDSGDTINVINTVVDTSYIDNRVTPFDYQNIIDAAYINNLVQGVDSAAVTSIIDSNYIQTRQADIFRDSAFVTNIVDTVYIQARDRVRDSSFITDIVDATYINNLVQGVDSAAIFALIDSDYIQSRQTDIFRDSAFVTNIVDTVYIQARDRVRDSGFVQDIVDSAYINSLVTIPEVGVDSNAIFSLIDSAYINARVDAVSGGAGTVDSAQVLQIVAENTTEAATNFNRIIATANNQTVFTGFTVNPNATLVYAGGILIVEGEDWSIDSAGTTVTLTTGLDLGDELYVVENVAGMFGGVADDTVIYSYDFTADSNQTVFNGTDDNGATLHYNPSNHMVYINGIFVAKGADYTIDSGDTITLTQAANNNDLVSIVNVTRANNGSWQEITATTYNANIGQKLIVDTTSAVTVNLPVNPRFGDEVKIIDGMGNAFTNNITVDPQGNKINGLSGNLVIDVNAAAVGLVYYNNTRGWILTE